MAQEQSVLPRPSELLELTRRPAHVIEHPHWIAARGAALALIAGSPTLILLLGPAGSGKTTLLRSLPKLLGDAGRTACLLDFGDSPGDVGAVDVVLVDEADRLPTTRLDELLRDGRTVVLAALPAAAERFRRYPSVTVMRLDRLPADQARGFVAQRLAQLELPNDCLTEGAWAGLIAHGGGVPRLLIALLGLALFVAAEDDAERVTAVHVERAVAVRAGDVHESRPEAAKMQPEPARDELPLFLAAPVADDGGTNDRGRWGIRRASALTAVSVLSAAALLLIWVGNGHHRRAASPGIGTPPAAQPIQPQSVAAVAEPVGVSPPGTIVSAAPPPAAPSPPAPTAQQLETTPVQPAPTPTVAADTIPLLPAGAVVHVVLIYPRGDQAAAQRGLEVARRLRSGGFGIDDPFPVAPRDARRGISYYFVQDADAAMAIGRRLGGDYGQGRLIRLPTGAGLPRPGTIEIAVGAD